MKIDWKAALSEGWKEAKKHGNIEGPEKWALYVVLFFVIFFGVGYWYDN